MSAIVYRIVEHDGGWAYKLGDVYSETFPSREWAITAAERVAAEQQLPGDDEAISWQDEGGRWHEEFEPGTDRPVVGIERDDAAAIMRDARPSRRVGDVARRPVFDDRNTDPPQIDPQAERRRANGQPFLTVLLAGLCGYGLARLIHGRD